MSKPRRSGASRRPLLIILVVSLFIAIGYTVYRAQSQPSEVFLVQPVPLTYGDTSLTGTLLKDAPAGEPGQFLLVLSDTRPILLDVQGLDHLLGQQVMVTGILSPGGSTTDPAVMTVHELSANQ